MELESRTSIDHHEVEDFVPGRQLPPVDGGKDAWLFLAAGFIIEGLTWGEHLVGELSVFFVC
jgi:hypothetical protein